MRCVSWMVEPLVGLRRSDHRLHRRDQRHRDQSDEGSQRQAHASEAAGTHGQSVGLVIDRLIHEGEAALSTFLSENPDVDRQYLRQLIRQAKKEQQKTNRPWPRENYSNTCVG